MAKKNNQAAQGTYRRYENGKLISTETISKIPDFFCRIVALVDPVKSASVK